MTNAFIPLTKAIKDALVSEACASLEDEQQRLLRALQHPRGARAREGAG